MGALILQLKKCLQNHEKPTFAWTESFFTDTGVWMHLDAFEQAPIFSPIRTQYTHSTFHCIRDLSPRVPQPSKMGKMHILASLEDCYAVRVKQDSD
jgi:hypothetical protein